MKVLFHFSCFDTENEEVGMHSEAQRIGFADTEMRFYKNVTKNLLLKKMLTVEESVSHIYEPHWVKGFEDFTELQQRQLSKAVFLHHFSTPDFAKCMKRKSILERLSNC